MRKLSREVVYKFSGILSRIHREVARRVAAGLKAMLAAGLGELGFAAKTCRAVLKLQLASITAFFKGDVRRAAKAYGRALRIVKLYNARYVVGAIDTPITQYIGVRMVRDILTDKLEGELEEIFEGERRFR